MARCEVSAMSAQQQYSPDIRLWHTPGGERLHLPQPWPRPNQPLVIRALGT